MADEEGAAGAAPIQTEVARPPRRPLTYVDPHLRVQTPADEAGWRVLDGVTVLIVETLHDDDDDDNVRTRLEFKYFADSRKGYRFPWYNGRPGEPSCVLSRGAPMQISFVSNFDLVIELRMLTHGTRHAPPCSVLAHSVRLAVFYLVRPTAEVSGFADLIICDNTDDDRDNTEFWAYSGGEGEYFFFVRETDPDPNLPATMSDLSWMEPDGPPPCWSGSHYGWGPYVSIAPTFESELMERVYKRE